MIPPTSHLRPHDLRSWAVCDHVTRHMRSSVEAKDWPLWWQMTGRPMAAAVRADVGQSIGWLGRPMDDWATKAEHHLSRLLLEVAGMALGTPPEAPVSVIMAKVVAMPSADYRLACGAIRAALDW